MHSLVGLYNKSWKYRRQLKCSSSSLSLPILLWPGLQSIYLRINNLHFPGSVIFWFEISKPFCWTEISQNQISGRSIFSKRFEYEKPCPRHFEYSEPEPNCRPRFRAVPCGPGPGQLVSKRLTSILLIWLYFFVRSSRLTFVISFHSIYQTNLCI